MVKKFEEFIGESVWGDIRKKSLGTEKRIENDIDKLSFQGFLDYLQDAYIPTNRFHIHTHICSSNPEELQCISVPIEDEYNGYPVTIYYYVKGIEQPERVAISTKLFELHPELMDSLKEEYDVEKPPLATYTIRRKNGGFTSVERPKRNSNMVTKKTGTLTNTDCVNILDLVLSMIKEPLFIKKK